MRFAIVNGARSLAAPGMKGVCPGCRGDVIAKCGEVLKWHWSHVKAECDSWGDGESDWHIGWKERFPIELQEVFMGEHRADIKGAEGVLEVQASPISTETIREREDFYGRMAWMLKGEDFIHNFEIKYIGGFMYGFKWKKPRPSWGFSRKTIFIDFPFGIFQPDFSSTTAAGRGVFVPPSALYEFVCGDNFAVPESAKDWYLSATELYEKRALVNNIAMQMDEISNTFARSPGSWFKRFLEIRGICSVPAWVESINSGSISSAGIWKGPNKYLAEVAEWKKHLNDYANCAAQWSSEFKARKQKEHEERLEQERLRAFRDLEEQARRDEAARVSAERLRQEMELQRLEAERRAKLEAASARASELLRQVTEFALEQSRGDVCSELLALRPAPFGGFGRWGTAELLELKASLLRAKGRLGDSRWEQAVKQGAAK